jgi:hypothetical protein
MRSTRLFFADRRKLLITLLFAGLTGITSGQEKFLKDITPVSTLQEAEKLIDTIGTLPQSSFWPKINPSLFLRNLKLNIDSPSVIYAGRSTDFCGYGALTYIMVRDNPLGYLKCILDLYLHGNAKYGKITFHPSPEIRQAAGTLQFKGTLDIHPADQLWFLCLADHFKGYLNIFDPHYKIGDENRLWAGVNYTKFNRMIRKLLNYSVNAKGSDLIRPWWVGDLYTYLSETIQEGTTVLFLNNTYLHRKNHSGIKPRIPTHYVILEKISKEEDDLITIVYWDYGGRSLRQVTPEFLKKIVYGISICTKKQTHEK